MVNHHLLISMVQLVVVMFIECPILQLVIVGYADGEQSNWLSTWRNRATQPFQSLRDPENKTWSSKWKSCRPRCLHMCSIFFIWIDIVHRQKKTHNYISLSLRHIDTWDVAVHYPWHDSCVPGRCFFRLVKALPGCQKRWKRTRKSSRKQLKLQRRTCLDLELVVGRFFWLSITMNHASIMISLFVWLAWLLVLFPFRCFFALTPSMIGLLPIRCYKNCCWFQLQWWRIPKALVKAMAHSVYNCCVLLHAI